ncbi:MAG: 50S ribosomal protein L25 [Acidobacteriota bacterium]|nr:50S ribosomal protein L25 [Acidobacteriota bacterium]
MSEEAIPVTLRTDFSKAANTKLRKSGLMPAVVYGLNEPPANIAISPKIVARILSSESGRNSMVYMQREGTDIKRHVIIQAVQRHPVTGRLVHVDFMRVDPTHKVRVKVPVRLTGIPTGVKTQGGSLDFVHRVLEIECLPSLIPGHIDVNVEAMKVGDSIRFDQLDIPATLRILGGEHEVVCSVRAKAAEEAVEAAAAEASPLAAAPAAEPEVAKKGKKDEKK